MSARPLNALERAFLSVVRAGSLWREGYVLGFAEELVRHHGIRGFFRWAEGTERALNVVMGHFGDEDGHLMAAFASFFNGCDYCAYGHVYAHNVHYFRRTGELFPLDEAEVVALMRRPDDEVLQVLEQRLGTVEAFARKRALLARLHLVRSLPGPLTEPDDLMLLKCSTVYEWINECSITAQAPSPPLGKVAKEKALLARYGEARDQARAAHGP